MADPAHEPYTMSYQAGVNGMGGTEAMSLVAHNGKLYAGIGYWKDNESYPGSQILVLDSPTGQWRVEHTFAAKLADGNPESRRVAALKEITFRYDRKGNALAAPVSLLLAANDNFSSLGGGGARTEDLAIFSLDDSSDKWTKMTLPIKGKGIRSFGFHHDSITGADYVFAGTYDNGFLRGVYDPSSAGKISWDLNPEGAQPAVSDRVMSFGDCAKTYYASSKPSLYQYVDGANEFHYSSHLRGLTGVGGDKLMGVLEGNAFESKVLEFFPQTEALNIVRLLKSAVGTDFNPNGATGDTNIIGAYNDIPKVTDPTTGQNVWLVGLGFSQKRRCPIPGKEHSSWFLSRSASGSWSVHEIPALGFIDPQPCPPAVRTMAASPFPQDQGQALYIGFYDTHGLPCHNTAHIFRVGLATALRPFDAKTCSGSK
jgi:hypothetical protein